MADSPFLQEHQSSENTSDGTSPTYNPTADEKKIIKHVESIYSKAKKYRKQYEQKWVDYYKMYRGRQWKEIRPAYRHSEVVNVIFQTIQSMVPILTDSRPKIDYVPTLPQMYELADILSKVAENDWAHNNWLTVLTEIIYDSHIYGTAFGGMRFDKDANNGLGNIVFESEDTFCQFPDPNGRDINEDRNRNHIFAEPVDIDQIKKDYPDQAQYFTSDIIDLAQGNKTDLENVMFKSPVESRLMIEGTSMYETAGRDQVLKITLYSRDGEIEESEATEKDLDGNEKKVYVQKKKYPNGRKIVIAAGVLCEDTEFELGEPTIAKAKINNYLLPREFWGISEVEQLEMPQKALNRLYSFAHDNLTLMGNPIWVVGTEANIDTDNLFNKPGLVLEPSDISQVRREEGVELPGYVMPLIEMTRKFLDSLSGETDMSRGAEPNDVTAASAIGELQEAQQTRLRLKTRLMDGLLTQLGKIYLKLVFKHYRLPRIVRVTGDDNATSFFHFHVEERPKGAKGQDLGSNDPAQDQDSAKAFSDTQTDPSQGTPETEPAGQEDESQESEPETSMYAVIQSYDDQGRPEEIKEIEIIGDFDVRVTTGSALPFAKQEKVETAFKLFQLQVIDDEELLKNLDYPNYEQVLARNNEKKQQMAQQQAAMQAQAKAGPPGPGMPSGPPTPPPPP